MDLSLHKLVVAPRKHLKRVVLFRLPEVARELWTDVNKPGEMRDSFVWALITAT